MSFSPYLCFSRKEWCSFRKNTPMTLDKEDIERLQGVNEKISLSEVEEIYLPLSRLLSLYVCASQALHKASSDFLGKPAPKVPYLIGVSGSVAVGKSTSSRLLEALLSRGKDHPKVSLVTTDGFLYSLAELERRNLLEKKGFPESYDIRALIQFLAAIKSGEKHIKAPVYSHHTYDIIANEFIEIKEADIVIIEGLNILQTATTEAQIFVSDFLDFTIFVDADTKSIKQWFIERVIQFKNTYFKDPDSYFNFIAKMSDDEAIKFCKIIWQETNERNLYENILPFKNRAQLILHKGPDHKVQKVYLRKL